MDGQGDIGADRDAIRGDPDASDEDERPNQSVPVKQEQLTEDVRPSSDTAGESRHEELDNLIEVVASNVNKQQRRPLLRYLGLSEAKMNDLDFKAFISGLKYWKTTRGANAERLLKAVIKMNTRTVKGEPASFLSDRNKLYVKISNSLKSKAVKQLRSIVVTQKIFGAGAVEKKTPQEILNKLEADGWIGEGNMGLLVDILKQLGQSTLAGEAEVIENAEKNGGVKTEMGEERTMNIKQDLGDYFERLADRLGPWWERLAFGLGFKSDDIEALKKEHPPEMCPFHLLKQWVEAQDAVMLKKMNEALKKAGLHQIADDVESGSLFQQDDYETSKDKEDGQEDSSYSDDSSQDSDEFCSIKDYQSCKSSCSTDSDDDSVGMSKEEASPELPPESNVSVKQPAKASAQKKSTNVTIPFGSYDTGLGSFPLEKDKRSDRELVDSSTKGKLAEDDISIFPTSDNMKKWEEVITANLDETSAKNLKSSYRTNMLVMHHIKDEYHHEPLCTYWKDNNMSLPGTATEYMSYLMTKLATKNCEARGLSSKSDYSDVQSKLGQIIFHPSTIDSKTVPYDLLFKSFGDELDYALAWIEPVGCNPGEPGRCSPSQYRFKHESSRQYVMAVWLAQRLCTEGETSSGRANRLLYDCFFGTSGWDYVCYHVAGLMADKGEVSLFNHHLSRVLWKSDGELSFDIQQKCAICIMESQRGSEIVQLPQFFSHIFPDRMLDLTSWPNMSYIGKLAFTNLKDSLIVKLPTEVKLIDVILNSKKSTTKTRTSLLAHLRSNPNLFWKLVHYLPFRDSTGQAFSLTDSLQSIKTFHFDGFGLGDDDFERVIMAFQFAPFVETVNFRGNNISSSSIHMLCNAMVYTPVVQELIVSHSNLTDESVQHLVSSLIGFKHLRCLNVSHNSITSAGAKAVVQQLPQLSRLDLSHNQIDDEMVTSAADLFTSRPCMLGYLDVTCNNISTSGYKMLLRVLSEVQQSIEVCVGSTTLHYTYTYTLIVHGHDNNREITIQAVDTDIFNAAHEVFPELVSVLLSHNGRVLYAVHTDEGKTISQIKPEAVLGSNGSENMKALSSAIPIGQHVQEMAELRLSGHLLGDDSVRLLPAIFDCIPHLKQLDLSINNITSDGIHAVFKDFPAFKGLEVVNLGYNQFTSKCLPDLATAFLSLASLKEVTLSDIRCTAESLDDTLRDVKSFVLSLRGRVCKLEWEGGDLLYDGSSGEDSSDKKGKRRDSWCEVADRLKGGEPVNIKVENLCITLSLSVREESNSEKRKIDYSEASSKEKRQRKV